MQKPEIQRGSIVQIYVPAAMGRIGRVVDRHGNRLWVEVFDEGTLRVDVDKAFLVQAGKKGDLENQASEDTMKPGAKKRGRKPKQSKPAEEQALQVEMAESVSGEEHPIVWIRRGRRRRRSNSNL